MAPTLCRYAGRCPPRGLTSLGAAQREVVPRSTADPHCADYYINASRVMPRRPI